MTITLRSRTWLVVVTTALSAACGEQAGRSTTPPTPPAPLVNMEETKYGPGLRPLGTASLKLPVPRSFDLSHVKPGYFAVALGKDSSRIFDYVRDEIAFEPYAGALRGPRGTLLAMAGNSIDRASLLASLLTSSGRRVRYARGTLSDSRARQLVASIWAERPVAAAAPTTPPSTEVKTAGERLFAAIQRDTLFLRDTLKKAGHPKANQDASRVTDESLITETRDHYWIELWQGGSWSAMDPSFASAKPGESFADAEQTFERLPDELFHRVDIRVQVEESAGEAPVTREALHYSATAADLSGVGLVFIHETGKGQNANEARPIILAGNEKIAGSPFALKAKAGNSAGGVADALSGGTDAEPIATAEYIEIAFTGPGGGEEKVVRWIFDRIGKAGRRGQESLTNERFTAIANTPNPDRAVDSIYDLFVTTGAIDSVHLTNLHAPSQIPPGEQVDPLAVLRRIGITFSAASDGLITRMTDASGRVARVFLDTPRVQITELSAGPHGPRLSLDLRRDRARTVTMGFDSTGLFYGELARGVINGTLERIVLEHLGDDGVPGAGIFSTSSVFERAQDARIPVALLSDRTANAADFPADTRAWIDAEMTAGNLVIAPLRPVPFGPANRLAWWVVDPRTGSATAVTDEGLHQADVEAHLVRTDRGYSVVYRVDGRVLPRTDKFLDYERATRFLFGLSRNLARRGVSMDWFTLGPM